MINNLLKRIPILLCLLLVATTLVQAQTTVTSTEPNDLEATSNAMVLTFTNNTAVCSTTGASITNGDVDYYRLYLPDDYTYTITTKITNATGGYAYYTYKSEDQSSNYSFTSSITINSVGDRTFYFKVAGYSNAGYTFQVTVTRNNKPLLTSSTSYFHSIPAAGGDVRMRIFANCAWKVETPTGITVTPNTGSGTDSVTIHVGKNESVENKTWKIRINGGLVFGNVEIDQLGVTLTDPNESNNSIATATLVRLPAFTNDTARAYFPLASFTDGADIDYYKLGLDAGYTYVVTFNEHEWEVNSANLINNADVSLDVYGSDGKALDGGSSYILKGANTLYCKAMPYLFGNYQFDVFVKRYKADFLEAEATRTKFTSNGSYYSPFVDIKSTLDWKVKASDSWIEIRDTAGEAGSTSIGFKILPNTTTSIRTGSIIFTATGMAPAVVTLTQDGLGDVMPDMYESNNSSQKAYSIPLNFVGTTSKYAVNATIDNKSDVDYYKITLPTDGNYYRISSVLIANNGSDNGDSYLLRANLFSGKDTSNLSDLKLSILKGGETFYSKVASYLGADPDTGSYQLNLTVEKISSPYFITTTSPSYHIGWQGDSIIDIVVNTNVTFVAKTYATMENTVVDPSYDGNATSQVISVKTYLNHTTSSRKDTIYLYPAGLNPVKIPVLQAAGVVTSFSLSDTLMYVSYAQASIPIDITSNTSIYEHNYLSWAYIGESGFGNRRAWYNVYKNTSASSRNGYILYADGLNYLIPKLHLYQAAYSTLPMSVTLSDKTLQFTQAASNKTITLSANSYWNISTDQDWLSVDKKSGVGTSASIKVSVTANATAYIRRAKLLITVGDSIFSIPVTQATATAATLGVQSATLKVKGGANIVSLNILSNVQWTAASSNTWIAFDKKAGWNNSSIAVAVSENPLGTTRTATITLQSGSLTQTVSIVQAGNPNISIDKNVVYLPGAAGSFENIKVTSNANWTVTSDSTWVTASPASGTAGGTVVLAASVNNTSKTRWTNVIFKADTLVAVTKVYQLALNPSAKAIEDTMEVAGTVMDSAVIHVNSNMLWDARSMATWVTLRKTSGINSDSIRFVFTENPEYSKRYGEIYLLSSLTHDIVDVIGVRQGHGKAILTISDSVLNFTASQLTQNLSVVSNHTWTANAKAAWLTYDKTSKTGNNTIVFTATMDSIAHQDTVWIVGDGIAHKVIVHVDAPLNTKVNQLNIPSIQLYPNPSHGSFYLNVSDIRSRRLQVLISDVTGRILEQHSFDTSATGGLLEVHTNVSPGQYILQLTGTDLKVNKQLVIIK